MSKRVVLNDHWVGDPEDESGVAPLDDITVHSKPVEPVLYLADGTPLVKQRRIGFTE